MMKWLSKWNLGKYLLNENGTSQIIVMCACLGVTISLLLFGFEMWRYIATYMSINSVADNVLSDSMRINNGLTPSTRLFIENALAAKGLDLTKVSITGTAAAVPFGTSMSAMITYNYQFPTFHLINSVFPTITVDTVPIHSPAYMYALGVIR